MVPKAYITAWRNKAPWQEDYQVEQDLVIERSLMAIYEDDFLRERLAFRGGTALHKLHLAPAVRYSEDIDLVQVKSEPFGPIINRLREVLSFLGNNPVRKQKQHNNTLIYRFNSEDDIPLRLKVEVNCREHHTIYGIKEVRYTMDSEWYKNKVLIPTYELAELLGTKMRAMYQRSKGRDLFDMWYAMKQTSIDSTRILEAWNFYMEHEEHSVTKQEFMDNMGKKAADKEFATDMEGLLRPGILYNVKDAYKLIEIELLEKV
ncbi:nucleotidyl transferase AbiEii/AbiGii toxin family protein [Rubrolithibacter danxiaensis]|uniref:nucleotidyl transferase AbiEii/AbiGii toxin family protein n=1 Tax=Rubrolithibacter danxiaensis TaxID=3390805 RepID=UPI003BF819D5